MALCLACSCFRASNRNVGDENVKASEDEIKENAEYGTIQNTPQNVQTKRKFGISFKHFKTKKENETVATDGPSLHNSFNGKIKQKKVLLNKKTVSFPWRRGRRKSTTCSGGPTYDYIDAINDPVYSKVDENPSHSHRYDYPTFASYSQRCQPNEPLYTSASQIYSVAGDDPYSSIVSELDNARSTNYDLESNSSAYEVGYEKVAAITDKAKAGPSKIKMNGVPFSRAPKKNLDALYAKINRPSTLESNVNTKSDTNAQNVFKTGRNISHEGGLSSSAAAGSSSANNGVEINSSMYQLEESGSGSVGSCYTGTGSSQNPSYRYLTVRESVDVIRERIRQQELANNQRTDDLNSFQLPHREHYYSTIANEYESVGGDDRSLVNGQNVTNNTSIDDVQQSERLLQDQRRQQMFRLLPSTSSLTSPLSLLTGRFQPTISDKSHISQPISPEGAFPKPPTSPIPNRSLEELRSPPKPRPIILSPTLPLPDSILKSGATFYNSSNMNGGFRATIPPDSSNSHPNLVIAGTSSAQQDGNFPNASCLSQPPLPIVQPRINAHHFGTMDAKGSRQRYSYSYDPRTATFVAHASNTSNNKPLPESAILRPTADSSLCTLASRNRISVPTNHLARATNFLNGFDGLTPPPLPPLPTPFKTSNMPQLLKKSAEMCKEPISGSGISQSSSRPITSRIPVSARNTLKIRSRTPSPTAEIGTQTINLSEPSSNFHRNANISSKTILSGERINQTDENRPMHSKRSARKLSPPPMPVGNDYVSTIDLGSERGWPFSPDKVNGITAKQLGKNEIDSDVPTSRG